MAMGHSLMTHFHLLGQSADRSSAEGVIGGFVSAGGRVQKGLAPPTFYYLTSKWSVLVPYFGAFDGRKLV